MQNILIIDQVTMGDTLVVHFDDVMEDRDAQLRWSCETWKSIKEKKERVFLCRRIIRFLKLVPDERRLECVLHGNFDIYKVFQSFFISVTIGGTGAAARYILLPQRREKKPMKTSPWTLPLLEKVSNNCPNSWTSSYSEDLWWRSTPPAICSRRRAAPEPSHALSLVLSHLLLPAPSPATCAR